jgi:NADH-quinone oxidoreductase subunit E
MTQQEIPVMQNQWSGVVEKVLIKNGYDKCALIAILQDLQKEAGYLPREALEILSHGLAVPVSQVFSVATFYKAFKLSPTGKHIIKVCLGTACHIRGGPDLMRQVESELGVKEEEVTKDGLFSFEAVRCVGCCGLAPVLMIDETFYGKVTPKQIRKIVSEVEKK